MSYAGRSWLKLDWCRAVLLVALPTACAVGVDPTIEGDGADPGGTAGTAGTTTASGGTLGTSGSSALPKAGTTSMGGSAVANPFGGSASAGTSTGGSSSAGSTSGGAGGASSAGTSSGGSAGAAGKGSGGSAGAGGTGGGGCACPVKKTWADNTNLTIAPMDCVDVAGAIYLYTGAKTQTWANKDCNPTMQAAWCSDVGADYKFMLCK